MYDWWQPVTSVKLLWLGSTEYTVYINGSVTIYALIWQWTDAVVGRHLVPSLPWLEACHASLVGRLCTYLQHKYKLRGLHGIAWEESIYISTYKN